MLAACLPPTAVAAGPQAPTTLEALQARLRTLMDEDGIPGFGVVLIRNREPVWIGGLGVADSESGRRVDAQTRFRIGSATKAFLALALQREIRFGRLSLDTPVRALAPEIPIDNPWEATDPVRLVHVLEHTAGFDDFRYNRWLPASPDASTEQRVMQHAPMLRVRWRPGERASYSNTGYGLAGYLLEKVSGERVEGYISRHVIAPLGMADTVWADPPAEQAARSHPRDARAEYLDDRMSLPAAGALWSSPRDLAKLLMLWLSDGASAPGLVDANGIARSERPATSLAARAGLDIGFGLGNFATEYRGRRYHGHDGGTLGYTAWLRYDREHGNGFVALYNTASTTGRKLRDTLVDFLQHDLAPPMAVAAVAPEAGWEGWYVLANPRVQLTAGFDRLQWSGRLRIAGDGYALAHAFGPRLATLLPLPGGLLREPDRTLAHGALTRDADGRRVLILNTGKADELVLVERDWFAAVLPVYGLAAALLVLASGLLLAPAWGIVALRARRSGVSGGRQRAWPLLALAALLLAAGCASAISLVDLASGQATWAMWGVCVSTLLVPACGAIGLAQGLRGRREVRGIARFWVPAASLSALGIGAWLWQAGLLGIRLWQ
jgi:CubicO group peptidase (beta-lactamase class C family)